MLKSTALRAALGVLLCVIGFLLSRASHSRQVAVRIDAGGCHMVANVLDNGDDHVRGYVVLLHGLAANKEIMSYLARSFASQNLRVFVPDLPGHGRTPGPFSPDRAQACSEQMIRQLILRGAINPSLTVLAGHSMGGAIALRIAAHLPVAGVIAISPAPMRPAPLVWPEFLLYTDPPPAPANTLVLNGALEPQSIRNLSRELLPTPPAASQKYQVIPVATHASLIFDHDSANAMLDWTAHILGPDPARATSPLRTFCPPLLGFLGLLILARPFLNELLAEPSVSGATLKTEFVANSGTAIRGESTPEATISRATPSLPQVVLQVLLCSVPAVLILRYVHPLRFLHLFEGDYFAAFLLLLGILLLLWNRNRLPNVLRVTPAKLVAAAVAALVFHFLATAWSDLTVSEAWLTLARWARFPVLLIAVLPYHIAEEALLGPPGTRSPKWRLAVALLLRLAAWSVVVAAILLLHSGQMLLVLLVPYIALFCLFQRAGMDVVRNDTRSALAAALFGAILLAGFCLVIFPVT
jgi:pimeloyl-ACP methyl ester carboxylesterase